MSRGVMQFSVAAKKMRARFGPGGSDVTRLSGSTSAGATAPTGPSVSPEARSAIQAAMDRYGPGGDFGKDVEAGLQRGRTQALSSGMQNLVSSGLAGTTMAGGLGKKYEEEVAAPTRANLASVRSERISALQTMLAQMEQGGYQAGLGREFAASESAAGRSFSASQSALQRGMSRMSPSGGQRTSPRPQAPAPISVEGSRAEPSVPQYVGAGRYQSPFMQSAEKAYTPGDYVGSMNNQRYIYSETGFPVRA